MTPPRVYVAAPLACALKAHHFAEMLRVCGYEVTSTWHDLPEAPEPGDAPARVGILTTNIRDLDACDAVVALLHAGTPRATYAEIGYALAQSKPVAWVHGPEVKNTCIFDAHPLSFVAHSASDVITWLARQGAA